MNDQERGEVRDLLRKELRRDLFDGSGPVLTRADIQKFGLEKETTLQLILDELRLHTQLLRTLIDEASS